MVNKDLVLQKLVDGSTPAPSAEISYCVEKLKAHASEGQEMESKAFELQKQLDQLQKSLYGKMSIVQEYRNIISDLMDVESKS